jgi:hypothetical protein
MDYVEAAETIVQRHPGAVVIRRVDSCLVLLPSEIAVSSYSNARVFDRDSVTGWVNAARTDAAVLDELRRLAGRVAPHNGVVDDLARGIPDLVAAGRILAIHAPETEQPLPITGMEIDYRSLLMRMANVGRDSIGYLLEEAWCQTYEHMPRDPKDQMEIVDIAFESITYVYDVGANRVVGAYGWSRPNLFSEAEKKALESRRKQFLAKATKAQIRKIGEGNSENAEAMAANAGLSWQDRFFKLYGHDYDRGHIIAQSLGGGMDINLCPQKRSFNQRKSAEGNLYRSMETKAERSPNAFVFSRPIYSDKTWVPQQLDYGVATDFELKTLEYRTFENR